MKISLLMISATIGLACVASAEEVDSSIPLTPELTQIVGSARSPLGRVKKVTPIRASGGRVSWSHDRDDILMDRKGEDGYYDIYRIRPDGSDEVCLTCDQQAVLGTGHIGQPEWHPSGKYIVFQAQKKFGQGRWGRDLAATPGLGRHSDLWLMELETRRCFRLTDTPEDDTSGVLHPHFSHDGGKLTWSEMYEAPKFLNGYGEWKIQVGDLTFGKDGPVLSNVKSYVPGRAGWYENHGLSPDNGTLLFTSAFENDKAFHANVYRYIIDQDRLDLLADQKWNEHALYSPSGTRIVWMSGRDTPKGGTDYWSMNLDGSDKVRLTDFSNPDLPTYNKKSIVAADASFSPDGKSLIAYLQVNLVTQEGVTVLIELEDDWELPGQLVPLP
ncbi:MAG: hypothetical protein HKN80_07855 [Acidimicrobiia bacterium]|nr:hypothetical protein [Acidimicrobiia bacterium]